MSLEYILGIIQIIISVLLVIAVLFQTDRSASINGSIAGGSDTFFSKNKSRSKDVILSRATTVLSLLFVALTVAILFVTR